MKHLRTYEGILDIFKNKPKQHFPYPNDSDKQPFLLGDIVWVHCTPDDFYEINRDIDEPMRIIFIRDNKTKHITTYDYGVQFLHNKSEYIDFEVMEDAVRKCTDYELNAYKYNV